MRTPAPVIAALASLAILAACSPAAAPTTAAPLPTVYTCQGGATCSHEQWDQEQAQQKLFVEAETVYREVFGERLRLTLQGGAAEPTEYLRERAEGGYLNSISALLRDQFEQQQNRRGTAVLTNVRILDSHAEDVEISLSGCEDGRDMRAEDQHGEYLSGGSLANMQVHFRRIDGKLKIVDGSGERAESCAA